MKTVAPETDLLADMAQEIAARCPELAQAEIDALVMTLRSRWGGTRVYIQKGLTKTISDRNAAIRTAYQKGRRVPDIALLHGCSVSQVERALGWK